MAKKKKHNSPVTTSGPTASQKPVDEAAMNAMMKARLAYAHMFGNPASQRLISPTDNPYDFGNGDVGTHFMSSIDNYAVPQIQNENGQLRLNDYGPRSNEAIRFDSDEDANYFAEENYKKISPAFQQKAYGGSINNNNTMSQEQLTEFNGPSHEQNSLGGIPVGPTATVEGNETMQSDENYVYSDRNVLDKETANEFRLPSKWIGKTFADASKLAMSKSGRTDDVIEQEDTARKLDSLREAQEAWKAKELEKDMAMMQEKHPEAMQQLMQAQQAPQQPQGPPQGMPQEAQMQQQAPQAMPPMEMSQDGMPPQQPMAMGGFVNTDGPGDPPPVVDPRTVGTTLDGSKGNPVPQGYRDSYNKGRSGKYLMPADAVINDDELALWNSTGKSGGFSFPNVRNTPNPSTPSTPQPRGIGPDVSSIVPYPFRKGSYYNADGSVTAREAAPQGAIVKNTEPSAFIKNEGRGDLTNTFNRPTINYAGGGQIAEKIGSGIEKAAPLLGMASNFIIPGSGAAVGATFGGIGAGVSNIGTGADFKEVMKDVTIGGAKGAIGGIVPGGGAAAGAAMTAGQMAGQAGLQVAGQALEGGKQILNNNTLDASEQKTLQDQKALEQAEYNKANPNVAQGGVPVMPKGYGGNIMPKAYGGPTGGIGGAGKKATKAKKNIDPSIRTKFDPNSTRPSQIIGTGPNGELLEAYNTGRHSHITSIDTAGFAKGDVDVLADNWRDRQDIFPAKHVMKVERPGARYSGAGNALNPGNLPVEANTVYTRWEIEDKIKERDAFKPQNPGALNRVAKQGSLSNAGQFAYGGNIRTPLAPGGYTDGVDPNGRPMMATSEYGRPYDFEGIGALPIRNLYESPTLATDAVMPYGDPFRNSPVGNLPTVPSELNNDLKEVNTNAPFEYSTSSNTTDASPFDEDYTKEDWYKDLTEEEKRYFDDTDTDPEGDDSLDFTQTPLEMAGRLAPIGYNLVQGLRPSEQLDYDEFKDRSEISRVNPLNISPYQQGLNEQYQMALAKTGRNPAQAQALMNSANKNLGNIYLQKEQFDANQRKDYETRKQAQNVSNIRTKASIKDMNQRSEAARRNYLAETAKQAADLASAGRQDKLTLAGLKAMAPDFANNMKIASFRDQFQEWNKSQQDKRKASNDSEKSTS